MTLNHKDFTSPEPLIKPFRHKRKTLGSRLRATHEIVRLQEPLQMAHKMSNKCQSICIASPCTTRLANASAGDFIATLLFFEASL